MDFRQAQGLDRRFGLGSTLSFGRVKRVQKSRGSQIFRAELMECQMADLFRCAVEILEWIFQNGVAIGAVFAAYFGAMATLKTLRHKQYETAANMLSPSDHSSGGWNYVTRTAAIGSLAKLAKDHPKDYDEPVMRAFEAFLSFPPRYGRNAEKEGQVDYTSPDTVAIVQTINSRVEKQRKACSISLPPDRPFRVTDDGKVERNPDYRDPYA